MVERDSTHSGFQVLATRIGGALCLLIAAYYTLTTSVAIWHLGWSEMFTDQFTQYTRLLELPFPDNVIAPDNAHRQITSNLVRLADIHWGGGDQLIGVVTGLCLLLATLVILVLRLLGDRAHDLSFRFAAATLAAVALMWMGSARMQFHGNESVQVYLVMVCALVVITCVESLRARPSLMTSAIALAASYVAMLSFGTGVGVFGLLVAMMLIRRVALRWMLPTALVGSLGVFAYMFLMPGADGVRGSLTLAPLEVARNAAAWLSSFWVTSWLSFADAGIAGVNADLMSMSRSGAVLVVTARAALSVTGQPPLLSLAFAIGMAGLALLAVLTLRAWRRPDSVTRIEALGLGLSLFAACVAVLVALGRSHLFAQYPDQLLADRYVQWTNLFWLGLGLALGARIATRQWGIATSVAVALLVSTMVYPTHWLWYGWASSVERGIEQRAAEAQVGVIAPGMFGHYALTDVDAVKSAIAILRRHQVGMFRAPRNRLMGASLVLPKSAEGPLVNLGSLEFVPEERVAVVPGWHIAGHLVDGGLRSQIDGLLVANDAGQVLGLGEFGYRMGPDNWRRIDATAEGFDVYLRVDAPCRGLTLFGIDDAAQRFIPLATLPECAAAKE
ncbi:MAG: hypothetical protein SGI99_15245 [Pseudomonadota bacterium]|nr:hypothetical protein [Pseudomonadota bacterium]